MVLAGSKQPSNPRFPEGGRASTSGKCVVCTRRWSSSFASSASACGIRWAQPRRAGLPGDAFLDGTGPTRAPAAIGGSGVPARPRASPGSSGEATWSWSCRVASRSWSARGCCSGRSAAAARRGAWRPSPGPSPAVPHTLPGYLGASLQPQPPAPPAGTAAAGPDLRAAGGAGAECAAVAGQRGAADATGGRAGAAPQTGGRRAGPPRASPTVPGAGWALGGGPRGGEHLELWAAVAPPPVPAPPLGSLWGGVLQGAPRVAFLHPDHHLRPAETWSQSQGTCGKRSSASCGNWSSSGASGRGLCRRWLPPSPHHSPPTARKPFRAHVPHPSVLPLETPQSLWTPIPQGAEHAAPRREGRL